MPPLLLAHELDKSYVAGHGRCWARVQVLSALSVTLARGERLAIVGERGAGKTTLLHCLTGLRRLDRGTVRWDASRGAPYRLCLAPFQLQEVPPYAAALVELPADPRAAAEWIEALHAQRLLGGTWLVLATRLRAVTAIASRVLLLRDGMLQPVAPGWPAGRVAEWVSGT